MTERFAIRQGELDPTNLRVEYGPIWFELTCVQALLFTESLKQYGAQALPQSPSDDAELFEAATDLGARLIAFRARCTQEQHRRHLGALQKLSDAIVELVTDFGERCADREHGQAILADVFFDGDVEADAACVARIDDAEFAGEVTFTAPTEDVHRLLREAGLDPEEVGKRGAEFVAGLRRERES